MFRRSTFRGPSRSHHVDGKGLSPSMDVTPSPSTDITLSPSHTFSPSTGLRDRYGIRSDCTHLVSVVALVGFVIGFCLANDVHAEEAPVASQLVGEGAEDSFGWSVSAGGDVNGDGVPDLLVGDPSNDTTDDWAGRAYLFLGPLASQIDAEDADATFTAEAFGDNLGISVAGGFDVNGDGFGDVLIGARSNDGAGTQAGRAYLFLGPLQGNFDALDADAIISGNDFDELGLGVSAGDLNDDGFDDLIVGARLAPGSAAFAGQVLIFFGPVTGSLVPEDADATILGRLVNESMGVAIAVGDLDGDDADDLVLGGPRPPLNGTDTGSVYVFFGPIAGVRNAGSAEVILRGEGQNDEFGTAVGVGDADGDGLDDVLVGAHQLFTVGAGKAYLFLSPLLPTAGTPVPTAVFVGEAEADLFGTSVAMIRDTNGDGRDDMLMGAWDNAAGGSRAGRAYLFRSGVGVVPASEADLFVTGGPGPDQVGQAVAYVGDLNEDGLGDFAVGAPQFNDANGGYVQVIHGAPTSAAVADEEAWRGLGLRAQSPAVGQVTLHWNAPAIGGVRSEQQSGLNSVPTGLGGVPSRLEIWDPTGRLVFAVPVDPVAGLGTWNGVHRNGTRAHAGVYFASLHAGTASSRCTFVLLN